MSSCMTAALAFCLLGNITSITYLLLHIPAKLMQFSLLSIVELGM